MTAPARSPLQAPRQNGAYGDHHADERNHQRRPEHASRPDVLGVHQPDDDQPSSVNLLNGDVPLNPATSISKDNRTVVLNYNGSTLPAGATLTVTATSLITDLSGNALTDTTSQFTTTPAVPNSAPTVVSMRPGNGATGVPASTVITLFTSAPMNTGTISGALHIAQNGVSVSGTTNVGSNGQSIEFTPSSALSAGTPTQVFLDSTAQDIYGNYLSYFSGQFTTAGAIANTAATVQAANPFVSATNVPLNTIIQVEYNQALSSSTINNTNVTLYQYSTGTYLTPKLSLVDNGQVVNIAPTSNLSRVRSTRSMSPATCRTPTAWRCRPTPTTSQRARQRYRRAHNLNGRSSELCR